MPEVDSLLCIGGCRPHGFAILDSGRAQGGVKNAIEIPIYSLHNKHILVLDGGFY